MSEEKDLQEPDVESGIGELDELQNFVDITGIEDIDVSDNKDVFGELGDVSDLGDLPDVSEIEAMLSAGDSKEEPKVEVPDVSAIEEPEVGLPDVSAIEEPEVEIPDISVIEEPEIELPDISAIEEPEAELPDISAIEEPEAELPDISAIEESEADSQDTLLDQDDSLEDDILTMEDDMSGIDALEEGDISSVEPEADIEGALDALNMDMLDVGMEGEDSSSSDEPFALDEEIVSDLPDIDAMEENDATEKSATGDIDSMLDGLLDDLDMNGTLGETESADESTLAIEPDDAMADILGLDESAPLAMDEESLPEDDLGALFDATMVPDAEETKKEEPGFFKKVFGNVVTDEIAEQERQAAAKAEEDAAIKAEEDAKAAEEKAKTKEEKKVEKDAKKAEKKKEKEAKKAAKKAEKEEKKAEKEAEEAAELEIVGKLNKVGVAIIAIATIVFLAIEITGTNIWGYVSAKNTAENYFDMGKYTEAYQEAIGTEMRDKDPDSYNKIKVVMKVQQSLNAYQNYERVGYYPEAINALLQGLKKYDANLDTAVDLEVDDDMKKCRDEIISILQSEFNLSETEAYSLLGLDQASYTAQLIEISKTK